MKNIATIIATIIFLFVVSCKAKQNPGKSNLERIEWIKDYATCSCIKSDYDLEKSKSFIEEDPSMEILFDIGNVWFYDELDSLAINYLKTIDSMPGERHQEIGKKPTMLRCLEFRRSNSLDTYINVV